MNTILGQKSEQTQRFLANGNRIPVTVVTVQDNIVVGIKSPEKDHYAAYQIAYGQKKKSTKAILGHVKKANLTKAPALIREVKLSIDAPLPTLGEVLSLSTVLKAGDMVAVTSTSKGKGWAGGVKRYGFKGGPRTHGQSDRERAPGSIGQTTTPGRVYKGKKMAGRMGGERVTVQNLLVVDVDETGKTVLLKGLVPGALGSYLIVTKTGEIKEKRYTPLHEMHARVEKIDEGEEIEAKVAVGTEAPQETKEPEANQQLVDASEDSNEIKDTEEEKEEDGK